MIKPNRKRELKLIVCEFVDTLKVSSVSRSKIVNRNEIKEKYQLPPTI